MNEEYLELIPKGILGIYFSGGGSGGGQTTSTKADYMPWAEYVPTETYEAYKPGLAYATSKIGQGLTPEEQEYYKGQIISTTGGQFAGTEKALSENLARSGVGGGAKAQAISDLARSKAVSTATGLAGLTAQDIAEKRANLEEARKWVGLPGSPIQTGSTSSTTSTGGGS